MNLLSKRDLGDMREFLKRTHGGVTSFLPTESQADLIRMSLLKNIQGMHERGQEIWYETEEQVWAVHDPKETCAPVLVKKRDGSGWLFLTHHFLDNSRRELRRGESDVLVEFGGGMNKFMDETGMEVEPEDYQFNGLGELIGGKWVSSDRKERSL